MSLRRLRRVHIAADGSSSSLCRLQNGELLVNYNAPGPDGWQVNLVRSDDGGRTWSEPHAVALPCDGLAANCSIGTTQLASGTILMPFKRSRPAGHQAFPETYLLASTDNGRSWSDPLKLAPNGAAVGDLRWAYAYGRIRELSDSTIVVPVCGQLPGDRLWRSVHIRSHDGGVTWSEMVTVAIGMDNEHDIIELPGGRMLAVFRDWRSPRYGHGMSPLWESHSEDLGRTWDEPTLAFQALYGHSPSLFRTRRGTLICSYRYVGDLDIGICGVGFSLWDDQHGEWDFNHHVVDTPGIGEFRLGCGYPSWDYADDERILCVYHSNPTFVSSPSHPWPQRGFHSDVEGTFYVEED